MSAYSSIVPLVIVLSVTMIKEGYEDWVGSLLPSPPPLSFSLSRFSSSSSSFRFSLFKIFMFIPQKRYLSDRETNNYLCNVLRGNEFQKVPWSHVVVGDVLKVYNGISSALPSLLSLSSRSFLAHSRFALLIPSLLISRSCDLSLLPYFRRTVAR